MLKDFYSIPFKINENKDTFLENLFNKYSDFEDNQIKENSRDFIDYYKTEWIPYVKNGFLNCSYLKKEQRSNSYIENYNRRIKWRKIIFPKFKKKS